MITYDHDHTWRSYTIQIWLCRDSWWRRQAIYYAELDFGEPSFAVDAQPTEVANTRADGNVKTMISRNLLSHGSIFSFHVCFQGYK